jgi:hypothetical protein
MDKLATALLVGAVLIGTQVSFASDRRDAVRAYAQARLFELRDCRSGTVEQRLDCLYREVAALKRRLDGHDSRVIPLTPR